MSDPLTTLLRDSVSGIPAALRPAVELRQRAEHRQRVRRAVATGVTACLLVLAVVLGGGLTGGRERALELPVKKPEHGLSVLLIADELPYRQLKFKVNTSPREKDKPVATCQRAALHTLGPRKVWQRTFSSGNAGDLDAAQVVAEFASPQEAAAAFRTIADWFTSC
jgi:hypothetical protein